MESAGHALIIGAGVGGLTAANALYRTGWQVTVLERADALRPIGAGISQPPNAQYALDTIDLGGTTLGDRLRAVGEPAGAIGARHPDGRWIFRPSGEPMTERYGYPIYTVLRTDLLNVMAGELPEGTVRFLAEVRTVRPGDAGTRARVETTDGAVYEADLVVAADGGRSVVRSQLFPEHPGPEYGGYAVWWMLAPGIGDAEVVASETLGEGAIWGSWTLRDGRVYAYATMVTEPGGSSEDPIAPLRERFGDWHDGVRKVLAAVDPASVFRDDARWMRVPLPALHRGRVAMLGDAAHPMTSDLGQGGSQSIEDAVVLARLVAGGDGRADGGVVSALAAYTEARLSRTSDVVRRSKKMAAFHHPRTAFGRFARDLSLKLTSSERMVGLFLRRFDPVFGWKP